MKNSKHLPLIFVKNCYKLSQEKRMFLRAFKVENIAFTLPLFSFVEPQDHGFNHPTYLMKWHSIQIILIIQEELSEIWCLNHLPHIPYRRHRLLRRVRNMSYTSVWLSSDFASNCSYSWIKRDLQFFYRLSSLTLSFQCVLDLLSCVASYNPVGHNGVQTIVENILYLSIFE